MYYVASLGVIELARKQVKDIGEVVCVPRVLCEGAVMYYMNHYLNLTADTKPFLQGSASSSPSVVLAHVSLGLVQKGVINLALFLYVLYV